MSKYYYGSYYGTNYSKSSKTYYNDYNSYNEWDDSYYKTSYKPKTWSWSNWDADTSVEDAGDLFIKESPAYFTPTKSELRKDIHSNQITECQELCRFFYYKMINDKKYISDKYLDESKLNADEIDIVNKKKMVYEKFWTTDIPGWSPKEKAIYVINQINENGKGKGEANICNLREETIETFKLSNDDFWDPIYNELFDEFDRNTNDLGLNKLTILKKISMIKNLGSKFKIEKEIEEKIVANSHLYARKMMRDFSQVYNVELYQRMFPNFQHKLATKDLLVNVPIDKTEHKQKIIMLVDFSGSMGEIFKQEWVVAIVMERLKYVIKEECEIFFSYFVGSCRGFKHIYDRKTALDFWRKFSTRPCGGDTDLGGIVQQIGNDIKNGNFFDIKSVGDRPEILAIADGQDRAKTSKFKYKTNAISLGQDNRDLKDLCIKNNGIHVFITPTGHVNIRQ